MAPPCRCRSLSPRQPLFSRARGDFPQIGIPDGLLCHTSPVSPCASICCSPMRAPATASCTSSP
eukprot:7142043-Prorocentrum_lima.AAC.1